MNNAIYLTLKKLNNPELVSKDELRKAADAAYAAANAYYTYHAAYAYFAAYAAAKNKPESAKYWVNDYFEETGENKQDYLDAIEEDK